MVVCKIGKKRTEKCIPLVKKKDEGDGDGEGEEEEEERRKAPATDRIEKERRQKELIHHHV